MPLIDRGNQIETIQLICIYIGRYSVSNVFDHLFTHQLFSVPLSICTWVAENGCRAQCDSMIDCFSSEDVLEFYCNCKPAGPQTVHISIFSDARDVVLGMSVLLMDWHEMYYQSCTIIKFTFLHWFDLGPNTSRANDITTSLSCTLCFVQNIIPA